MTLYNALDEVDRGVDALADIVGCRGVDTRERDSLWC